MAIWCLRKVPNETTSVPPYTLAMGYLPRGPLAILRDSWCGDKDLPVSFGNNANEYLRELQDKLKIAKTYATLHAKREQDRYVSHYNLRSHYNHFDVGDQVLILTPDTTTSHTFCKRTFQSVSYTHLTLPTNREV